MIANKPAVVSVSLLDVSKPLRRVVDATEKTMINNGKSEAPFAKSKQECFDSSLQGPSCGFRSQR